MKGDGHTQPLFSIITVCWNAELLIRSTIASLASQEAACFEYLVIDGASQDNTLAVVNECAKGLPMRLVSEPDNGIYDAMNKGVRLARGDWLYFLNAGDAFVDAQVLQRVAVLLGRVDRKSVV